jgi:predicted XRE-type DNA-binding protein
MEAKTSARNLNRTQRRQMAVKLRLQGMTFTEIGEAMEIDRSSAYRLVKGELDRLNEQSQELTFYHRELELQRLDAALNAIWPQIEAGDLLAIDRLIKISQQRSKLLGLDAPEKIEQTVITDEEIMRELEKIIDQAVQESVNNRS